MIKVKVGGLKATIESMRRTQALMVAARPKLLAAGGAELLRGVRNSAGLQDGHTQDVLDALDNPYAVRHGSIQEGVLGHPGWWVHKQSGALFRSITGRTVGSTRYEVFADTGIAPHAEHVINGTSVMFPRDFVFIAGELRVVRRRIMRAMARVLGKEMRTKAHIRFGEPGIPGSLPPVRDDQGRFT